MTFKQGRQVKEDVSLAGNSLHYRKVILNVTFLHLSYEGFCASIMLLCFGYINIPEDNREDLLLS